MISLLVVNYRSAVLAADAVRTARASTSVPLQVVIVDNSCDAREAEALRPLADALIVSTSNRGYAGAINDGRRACDGDAIVISNPDVTFAPRAIDLLVQALDAKTAVSGPALFWDDGYMWHLPPGDLTSAPQKLDQILASRSRQWRAQRDQRRFRARVAFWSLTRTTPVRMLSGAVMAVRAQVFDVLRGFDARFPLYFEEADFLRRVHEHRKRIVYVPEARVRHIYNQSAAQSDGAAAERYAESEWKYLLKWNGPWLAHTLKRLEKPVIASEVEGPRASTGGGDPSTALGMTGGALGTTGGALGMTGGAVGMTEGALGMTGVITEASPLPTFDTAAGFFGHADDVPPEVRRSLGTAPLYLRYKIAP